MKIFLIATPLPDFQGREVLRCAGCALVQFRRQSPFCLRCRELLFVDELTAYWAKIPVPRRHPQDVEKENVTIMPNPTIQQIVAKRVLECRTKKGLSQKALANRMGIPRTYISKVERGYTEPSLSSLIRFSIALEVPVGDLLTLRRRELPTKESVTADLLSDPFLAQIAPLVTGLSARDRAVLLAKIEQIALSRAQIAA